MPTSIMTALTLNGETKTLKEWRLANGINPDTLRHRLNRGWDPVKAYPGVIMADDSWMTHIKRECVIIACTAAVCAALGFLAYLLIE
jgi:hypothetical protein